MKCRLVLRGNSVSILTGRARMRERATLRGVYAGASVAGASGPRVAPRGTQTTHIAIPRLIYVHSASGMQDAVGRVRLGATRSDQAGMPLNS